VAAYDAVIVGAGPNGLSAGIELARAGRRVLILEGAGEIGGGVRSEASTLPGFLHDVCSAVHPLAAASPFFRSLPLARHGLKWVHPNTPLAHPFDDGTAALLQRSISATARTLGADGAAYARLMDPLVERWDDLIDQVLAPVLRVPRHPLLLARFGMRAIRSARGLAHGLFREGHARALFGGLAAHSLAPLSNPPTAAFGLILGVTAHAVGWPIAQGGSRAIAEALAAHLSSLGGEIRTGHPVGSMRDLPEARAILFDVTPRQFLAIAGDRLPVAYRMRLETFRYGPGVFKIDWALAEPIPWTSPGCARAGTLHLGGDFEEMAIAERDPWKGRHSDRPFVLLAQPTLFDPTRAPPDRHVAWAYAHVPHGSTFDMTARIEAQVERFAPGFRDRILARATLDTVALERHNPNLVGGDISGGANTFLQTFFRPMISSMPYRTGARGLYLCSASTPPGGAVHGMCGYHAARAVIADGY